MESKSEELRVRATSDLWDVERRSQVERPHGFLASIEARKNPVLALPRQNRVNIAKAGERR